FTPSCCLRRVYFRCYFRCFLLLLHASFHFFFFNDTSPTDIYTLSLHDALPISLGSLRAPSFASPSSYWDTCVHLCICSRIFPKRDRKSTRLNSSHEWISYAVFCLKKKKIK